MPEAQDYQYYLDKQEGGSGSGEDFGKLPPEEYIFEVVRVEDKGPQPVPSQYAKSEGEKKRDVRVFCKPIAIYGSEDDPIVNTEGKAIHPEKTIQYFYKPDTLGYGPTGWSKNRKLLAAATDQDIKSRVRYEEDGSDLLGGKFIGVVDFNKKGYDSIMDIRPLKKRPARERPAPSLVEEAKSSFDIEEDEPF